MQGCFVWSRIAEDAGDDQSSQVKTVFSGVVRVGKVMLEASIECYVRYNRD